MYVCLEYYMKFYAIHRFYVDVHILYNILYGIKYMIHTKLLYECLDNVFVFPNLQTPSFKFSQVVFDQLQNFVLMSFQCKLLSQQLFKATLFTCDLVSMWNFGETWKTMCTTISQNFHSFNIIKLDILLFFWNHFKLGPEHKMTYNSLSTTPNSLRFWETHKICLMCLLKILVLIMMITKNYHFQNKLISKLRMKF
jgi:hypothetical protein